VQHTGQTGLSQKAPKHQTGQPNSKPTKTRNSCNTGQQRTHPDIHPRKNPTGVAPVRPVRGIGQTGVTWASRDEQHPRVNTSKSKLDLPKHSTGLNKTLGTIGTPHEESVAKFNPTNTCPKKRNGRNPAKNSSNPRTPKTPKPSPLTHGFGRGIIAQRTTKGSHKFPPSNPQEQGRENTPRK
jgi:hypothetical protein